MDADGRDYVSLAARRDGNSDPSRAPAILQYGLLAWERIGRVGSPVMRASEKWRVILEV
jgi:hypothetical protein